MNLNRRFIAKREERKNKLINKKSIFRKKMYYWDIVECSIPVVLVLFCIGIILFILFQSDKQTEAILDFIIASMAGILLIISLVCKHLSDRTKYIWYGNVIILAFSIGFVSVMIVSLNQKDGSVARIISLVALIVSVCDEMVGYMRFILRYIKERNERMKEDIEKIEKEGIFDNKFDA